MLRFLLEKLLLCLIQRTQHTIWLLRLLPLLFSFFFEVFIILILLSLSWLGSWSLVVRTLLS
jgi:hypothetical protein